MQGTIDTELEFRKYMGAVKHRMREEITDDFTLAILEEQDKEGVIQMTENAYYYQRLIKTAKLKATEWKFDAKTQEWRKCPLHQKYQEQMMLLAQNAFDTYMTKVVMTVVMNRNKAENHLVKILTGIESAKDDNTEKLREALTRFTEKQKEDSKKSE